LEHGGTTSRKIGLAKSEAYKERFRLTGLPLRKLLLLLIKVPHRVHSEPRFMDEGTPGPKQAVPLRFYRGLLAPF
jgi:hypothetical protein